MTNSLERALALLELLEQTPGGLRNSEISERLKIPRSTCSYIAALLERKGYLLREESTRRYQIGLKAVALAHGALRELGIRSMAEPILYRLVIDTGLSAGVGVLQHGRVLLVDRVEAPEFVTELARRVPAKGRTREQRDIGRELPAHATALGKILLAYLAPADLAERLSVMILTRTTPKTIVSKTRLMAEIQTAREQGYATAEEEQYFGIRALSAPIFDSARGVRAAISLNGELKAPAWDDLRGLVRRIQEAAAEISRQTRFT